MERICFTKKQFTLKRDDTNFDGTGVLITATVVPTLYCIRVEVHGGKYKVGNLFEYSKYTSIEELKDLFIDINDTIMTIII